MARIRNTANRSMKAALAKCSANRRYRIWPLRGQLGNVLAPLRTLPPSIRGYGVRGNCGSGPAWRMEQPPIESSADSKDNDHRGRYFLSLVVFHLLSCNSNLNWPPLSPPLVYPGVQTSHWEVGQAGRHKTGTGLYSSSFPSVKSH
jgi:hypothetical protein